jgi:phosphatidylserine/phosphatidylglycerophosphate/cardiolipin synthase-like enzyme
VTVDTARRTVDGLTLKAYRGDGAALLAFDVDEHLKDDLAGFAVECDPPDAGSYMLKNRLNFSQRVTTDTTPGQRRWTDTDKAPLQTFRWVHFPKDVTPGDFTYKATAMLYRKGTQTSVEPGPSAEVSLELMDEGFANLDVGFTRGFLSSQAYADRFDNAPFQPDDPTISFSTKPFERRWNWLGFHARRLIFDFLEEARSDSSIELDVFAYDLDEPDFIRALKAVGPRMRLFLDDSKDHKKEGAPELDARELLTKSAGEANVKTGHFGRFAHDKVLIQKRRGRALKVLTGSANFSIRGLYVQSNNVLVFDDLTTAGLYEQAFQASWDDAADFEDSPIASRWFERHGRGLPSFEVSFAPHKDANLSLKPVAEAIRDADSSVLFAIMDVGQGSGPVLDEIRRLPKRRELYAFGTTQRASGSLQVRASGRPSTFIPFDYLRAKTPEPFRPEIAGGPGQVIHHKFVVVDFNDTDPVVYAGSSNLAAGGEAENGDNLIALHDRNIATTYAVEAVRLLDHYRFRAAMKTATGKQPLRLKRRDEHWADAYFKKTNARCLERQLFVR